MMNMKSSCLSLLIFFQVVVAAETKNSRSMISAIEPLRQILQSSSAVITDQKGKSTGYGIVVSEDGFVLTKASTLQRASEFFVRVDRQKFSAEIIGESQEWDAVLLKLNDAEKLIPVRWSEGTETDKGQFVVSNGVTSLLKRRAKFGVVSANQREVVGVVAVLPFFVKESTNGGYEIDEVISVSDDQESLLLKGDVVKSIDGLALDEALDFELLYKGKWPGDISELVLLRSGEEHVVNVQYAWKHEVYNQPMDRNEAMSGRFSGRRTGFPEVIQHDIALSERTVGGPLLDLEGECIGMNIARFNRAETYAIPSPRLRELFESLKAKAQQSTSSETGQ